MTIAQYFRRRWKLGENVCEMNRTTGEEARLSDDFHACASLAVGDGLTKILCCRPCREKLHPYKKAQFIKKLGTDRVASSHRFKPKKKAVVDGEQPGGEA